MKGFQVGRSLFITLIALIYLDVEFLSRWQICFLPKLCSWMFITDPVINWILSLECVLSSALGLQAWKNLRNSLARWSSHSCEPEDTGPHRPALQHLHFLISFWSFSDFPWLHGHLLCWIWTDWNIHCITELVSAYFRVITSQSLFRQPLASLLFYVSIFSWGPGLASSGVQGYFQAWNLTHNSIVRQNKSATST